ncbi:MAG: sodium:proton antiporter, partial [Ignavibacteriaceae bacterium]|nr:sodium:proton antiporter [Ignavibacteriaceae bacterium]
MIRFRPIAIAVFLLLILFFVSTDLAAASSPQHDSTGVKTEVAADHVLPSTIMVLPFVLLLLMIATGPLFYHHFWEKHYPKVSIVLALITASYYLIVLHDMHSLRHTLAEYLSFIALLSSLFVASGGILIKVDKKSTPFINVLFLLFGAVISN